MELALSDALAPVLRDLGTCGAPVPDVRDDQWSSFPGQVTAMLRDTDGTGKVSPRWLPSRCHKESLLSPTRFRNGPSNRCGVLADPQHGLTAPTIRTHIR